MGNSVVRQTVFRGSWWTKECRRAGGDFVDFETIVQPPEERCERRAVEEECSNCGGDGLGTTVVDGGRDDAVGHQMVGRYYTEWYNTPKDVWRYYSEDAVHRLADVDGTRYVVMGQIQIRELFDNVSAPETGNTKTTTVTAERWSSSR